MKTPLAVAIALLVAPGLVAGQSLAAVAKKEEARRKQVKQSSRVYTNKDVGPAEPRATPPATAPSSDAETATAPAGPGAGAGPSTAPSPGPAADAGEAGAAGAAEAPAEGEEREQDEQQWRARITEARAALERNQMFAEALQSRINSLWMDFTARDDPAQRAAIDVERKKAIAQLDRVKSEIVSQTKAIADIEEEARRAGVPPGWLR